MNRAYNHESERPSHDPKPSFKMCFVIFFDPTSARLLIATARSTEVSLAKLRGRNVDSTNVSNDGNERVHIFVPKILIEVSPAKLHGSFAPGIPF